MLLRSYLFVLAAMPVLVMVPLVRAQEKIGPLPDPRPTYFILTIPSTAESLAPLATVEDQKIFNVTFDKIVTDAMGGSPLDRRAAAELLRRRADASGNSPGLKRLLLMSAFELSSHAGPSLAEIEGDAERAWTVLNGQTIAFTSGRVAIMERMAGFSSSVKKYAPASIAQEYFELAELRLDVCMIKEATDAFEAGQNWAEKDSAYRTRVGPLANAFKKALQERQANEALLTANPKDSEANRVKGLEMLVNAAAPKEAAPYLLNTGNEKIRGLSRALSMITGDSVTRLAAAQAADEAVSAVNGDDAAILFYFADCEARAVSRDGLASAAQKAQADLLVIKVRQQVAQIASTQPAKARFFGLVLQANKIVFIVDHSGSMLDNFDFVKAEASRSVGAFNSNQLFAMVLVSDHAEFVGEAKLQPATEGSKRQVIDALKKTRAEGQNDDLVKPFQDAFEKAFALKPDTIIFLTDGRFGDGLPAVIRRLNPQQKVQISTIGFVTEEATFKAQLEKLARDNGGTYRFVAEKELGH